MQIEETNALKRSISSWLSVRATLADLETRRIALNRDVDLARGTISGHESEIYDQLPDCSLQAVVTVNGRTLLISKDKPMQRLTLAELKIIDLDRQNLK